MTTNTIELKPIRSVKTSASNRQIEHRKAISEIIGPYRPNPSGLTVVELLERRGNILKVKGLDALDGTLVLDIKPFNPLDAAKKCGFLLGGRSCTKIDCLKLIAMRPVA
jgi:hypothetical protein